VEILHQKVTRMVVVYRCLKLRLVISVGLELVVD
jgi:hypothetical protein